MITVEELVARYGERKAAAGPMRARMAELKDAYNGDLVIPLPELERNEKSMVANLIATGLDQTAQRIASTMPDVDCPPVRPNIQGSQATAGKRRNAILGWWGMNDLGLMQRRRARWLVGYTCAPALILPPRSKDRDKGRPIPLWQARNPLDCFPPPGEEMEPEDCIFTFRRSVGWLRRAYPEAASALALGDKPRPDDVVDLLQYVDADEHQLVVLGKHREGDESSDPWGTPARGSGGAPYLRLERFDNLAKICTAVVPGRICLDRPQGQFDGLVGVYWWQAKLMALGGIAAERDIFPDEWVVPRGPNETPQIVVQADGLAGVVGEIHGGAIQTTHSTPGSQTMLMIDRAERAMRVQGGIPAEFTGESGSNIRTGRRGSQVLSAAVDFPIQEAQEILATSLSKENIRAIAVDKAYSGSAPRSFYFTWNGKKGAAEYDTAIWETDANTVSYSFPGSDINSLIIGVGQRIGMETMSHRRGMELDPLIDDPANEERLILAEGLQRAFMQGLQTMASTPGGIPIADLARISELVLEKSTPLYRAVQMVQEEAQARQASVDEQGAPAGVDPNSPAAQPGLALPGQGAEAGGIREMPPLDRLSGLLSSLRRPAMTLSSE